MKKFFVLILALAAGMVAMQSCKCTSDVAAIDTAFVYDVVGTAEGLGTFEWAQNEHTGAVDLNGKVEVKATNDTTEAKAFAAVDNAVVPTLADGLASEDPEVAAAAEGAKNELTVALRGFSGKVALGLTGYVKYGMMVFALDEHWQYPPVDSVAVTSAVFAISE